MTVGRSSNALDSDRDTWCAYPSNPNPTTAFSTAACSSFSLAASNDADLGRKVVSSPHCCSGPMQPDNSKSSTTSQMRTSRCPIASPFVTPHITSVSPHRME